VEWDTLWFGFIYEYDFRVTSRSIRQCTWPSNSDPHWLVVRMDTRRKRYLGVNEESVKNSRHSAGVGLKTTAIPQCDNGHKHHAMIPEREVNKCEIVERETINSSDISSFSRLLLTKTMFVTTFRWFVLSWETHEFILSISSHHSCSVALPTPSRSPTS